MLITSMYRDIQMVFIEDGISCPAEGRESKKHSNGYENRTSHQLSV